MAAENDSDLTGYTVAIHVDVFDDDRAVRLAREMVTWLAVRYPEVVPGLTMVESNDLAEGGVRVFCDRRAEGEARCVRSPDHVGPCRGPGEVAGGTDESEIAAAALNPTA